MANRIEKVSGELQAITASYINECSGKQSLITVTKVEIQKNLKNATIFVTVYPREKEEQAIGFLRRLLPELREYVGKKLPIKQLPFFAIEIDAGEKHRQDIDELLRA